MATAYARTDTSGRLSFEGGALKASPVDLTSTSIDKWERLEGVFYENVCLEYFFEETAKGNLFFPHLGQYNLLINHVVRELGLNPDAKEAIVQARHYGGMQEIKVGKQRFLLSGYKIYSKQA
jgi:hypothetical protein